MKRKISIPYVDWRDGRPRFKPGARLRSLGFVSQDLRHPESGRIPPAKLSPGTKNSGAWFQPGEAMDWSTAFAKRIDALQNKASVEKAEDAPAKRKNRRARPAPATAPKGTYPLSRLNEDWQRSDEFHDLAEKSRRDYASKMRAIEQDAPDVWASEIDALDRQIIKAIYKRARATRGNAMARSMIRILSSAITWGLDEGKFKIVEVNPALRLKMKSLDPRVRFASRFELETLVSAADMVGRPDMGDSFIAAVWSGQRQGDRLALEFKSKLKTRLVCKQSKTGAIVNMPIAPEFERRRTAAAARRLAAGIVSNHLILFEKTWRPFQQDTYRHYFSEIRKIAAFGLWKLKDGTLRCPVNERFKHLNHVTAGPVPAPNQGTCLVEPSRSLADFQEMDFRDTAVTWLALSGATVPEICAVTGHSVQSATQVLRHYLAMHPDMADSAISKMVTWYEKDGETEIGF
ncbi:hypothetical protein FMN50_20410 [Rhodobacterales bacterium]|nr:hypothetical protein FMN50_20410 [Rhodobacterales bacterium]